MIPSECVHEPEVGRAVRTGQWDDALRAHVASCETCSEVAFVAASLCADARTVLREAVLPNASQIWWKAQLRARQEAASRAMRPIAVVEKASFVVSGAVLIGVLRWLSPWLIGWFHQITAVWTRAARPISMPQADSTIIAAASSIFIVLIVALGLYVTWADGSSG